MRWTSTFDPDESHPLVLSGARSAESKDGIVETRPSTTASLREPFAQDERISGLTIDHRPSTTASLREPFAQDERISGLTIDHRPFEVAKW
jgi:hypothetical protein